MNLLVILGIAVGLAMDTFAVAVATSVMLGRVTGRQVFRFSFHFGLFQAMMPILGWLAGSSFVYAIGGWDHWIAFGLLAFIGGKAIYTVYAGPKGSNQNDRGDPTRGLSLVILSTATSIDALAVGISFAVLGVRIWYPAALIGLVTAAITLTGMLIGSRVGERFGKRVEVLGGLILIGIGLRILFQHSVH
jgi:putative Mn2+ efflux pump MntP